MSKHYKILSINGGGVRGLVPAKIIERMTHIADKPIHELFDYVVGTSAGGIIAISLTVKDEDGNPKYSSSDVVDIFKNNAQDIFFPGYFEGYPVIPAVEEMVRGFGQFFAPKYSRDGIDNLLYQKLGNATFLNTTMPITTISYSLDSDGPRLWSKYKAMNDPDYHNYLLRDAAGATSAAPTYFPPKITMSPTGEVFHDVDGGIFANSPTMVGVSEFLNAQGIRMHSDKLTVVSIGTGRFKDEPELTKLEDSFPANLLDVSPVGIGLMSGGAICLGTYFMPLVGGYFGYLCSASLFGGIVADAYNNYGGLGWIARQNIVDKMMKGAEISDAFQSKTVDVIRINPQFDKEYSSLDDTRGDHLKRFEKEIDNFVKKHEKFLEVVINCLESDGSGSECDSARSHSKPFGEDFYFELLGHSEPIEFLT